MPLVVRLPPAFLIRQKSKIFATFPPGEGFGAEGGFGAEEGLGVGEGFGWGRITAPIFVLIRQSRESSLVLLMLIVFPWDLSECSPNRHWCQVDTHRNLHQLSVWRCHQK